MLVLSRKVNESIEIGDGVKVIVLSVNRGKVRLGIQASREIPVCRSEVKSRPDDGTKDQ